LKPKCPEAVVEAVRARRNRLLKVKRHLTYANVMVTCLAVLVLGGGAAYASGLVPRNSVNSKAIINGQVKPQDMAVASTYAAGVTSGAVHAYVDPTPHVVEPVAPGGTATDTAGCGPGSIAIGGGVDWSLHKADGYVAESYPVSEPLTGPPTEWKITVRNTDSGPHSFNLYAVCLKTR
jgi:hypothetical protein